MSNPDINPGSVETQRMRVVAPIGVRFFFWCCSFGLMVFSTRALFGYVYEYLTPLVVALYKTK
jgi:hypothetical protein